MGASTAQSEPSAGCTPVPRGEKRRREIAIVAEHVFFENGFTDTTMQEIAARAGASKETLYRHFGSKEGLFAEIVENRAKNFLDSLDENFEKPDSVEEVLRSLGLRVLEAILGSDAISLCRTVVAESSRNPELGLVFLASGPDRVRLRLAEFFAAAKARGELSCGDCDVAARIFLGAVVGAYHLNRLILQNPPRLGQEQMDMHVDEIVAMFMRTYAR